MMLVKLLSSMDRARFDPVVVSLQGHGPVSRMLYELDVEVVPIGLRRAADLPSSLWRLTHLGRRYDPDLIQGWMYHGNIASHLVKGMSGRRPPVIWNIRQSIDSMPDEKRATAFLIRRGARLSRRAAAIIYNSHHSARQHAALGYAADLHVVIPNGFDCSRFVPSDEARRRIRSELGVDDDVPVIGLLARYHPMKDHASFLAAAALLNTARPDARYVLAGRGVNWENRELSQLVDHLALRDRVFLLGERSDTPVVLAGLDVATLSSSRNEGFPNVIGEAMACGVPCVATDVGDSSWVVGEVGTVVPARNPRALSDAWRGLLEMDARLRRRAGMAARARIEEEFSIKRVAQTYAQLYERVARPGQVIGVDRSP